MFFTGFFFLVSSLTDSNVLQTINRKVLVHGKDRVTMIPCKFKQCLHSYPEMSFVSERNDHVHSFQGGPYCFT